VHRDPRPEVGDFDHEAGTLDLGAHDDRAVVPPFEPVNYRVAHGLGHRELDVATIRPSGLRVLGDPRANLGHAALAAASPQLERRRFAA